MGKKESGKCVKGLGALFRSVKYILTPTLVTYFAQSGGLYIANGLYTWMTMSAVDQILCKIPAELNTTNGVPIHKIGCSNCTDNLLMCGKEWCYKAAMNITLKKMIGGSKKSWPKMFLAAGQDPVCNLKVSEAGDPVAVLVDLGGTINPTAKTNRKYDAGDDCIQWHCQVMLQAALTNKDLSSPTAGCTNTAMTKPDYLAKTCVCQAMPLTFAQAKTLNALCGPQSNNLPARVFLNILNTRDQCLQSSLKAVQVRTGKNYKKFVKEENCVNWLSFADTHTDWLRQKSPPAAPKGAPITPDSYSHCKIVMCEAAHAALVPWKTPAVACSWTVGKWTEWDFTMSPHLVKFCSNVFPAALRTNVGIAKAVCNITTAATICKELLEKGFRGSLLGVVPSEPAELPCTGVSMASFKAFQFDCKKAQANITGSSSSRRLTSSDEQMDMAPAGTVKGPVACSEIATDAVPISFDEYFDGKAAIDDETDSLDFPAAEAAPAGWESQLLQEPSQFDFTRALLPFDPTGTDSSNNRKLQAKDPNDNLMSYTTTAWSQCTCFQQCVSGVKTREVGCDSDKCASPKPENRVKCRCQHCASCDVAFFLTALSLTLSLQGLAGLLVFGAFFFADRVHIDDLAVVSWCSCSCVPLLGLICKSIPVFLRVFVYINMVEVVLLSISAFLPYVFWTAHHEYDCKTNQPLLLLAAVNMGLWWMQLGYGIYMKKYKPTPAQLHTAAPRGKIRRMICIPLRSIGP